jgi:hypothetical protein
LTWTSDGDGAFILNHGHVKPSGSLELKPDYSTTYTLVVEKNGVVEMATASVDIKGQRGSPLIPSRDDFKFSFKGRETILKYEDFLPVIEDVLQTNHFEFIGTFKKSDPYVVYYTDHSERNDLRGKDEHGRNAHRLSYCVQVNKPTADDPKEVKFTVFALVELRPVAESDWSASEDGELVRTRAEDLCKQISSAAEKPPK